MTALPSGLQYRVLRHGGGTYHPRLDSPCECHYAGTRIDGTEFDSSYGRGEPTTFAPNQGAPHEHTRSFKDHGAGRTARRHPESPPARPPAAAAQ